MLPRFELLVMYTDHGISQKCEPLSCHSHDNSVSSLGSRVEGVMLNPKP